jgi:hypothetical protein
MLVIIAHSHNHMAIAMRVISIVQGDLFTLARHQMIGEWGLDATIEMTSLVP